MHLSFLFTLIFKRKNVYIFPNCGPCWVYTAISLNISLFNPNLLFSFIYILFGQSLLPWSSAWEVKPLHAWETKLVPPGSPLEKTWRRARGLFATAVREAGASELRSSPAKPWICEHLQRHPYGDGDIGEISIGGIIEIKLIKPSNRQCSGSSRLIICHVQKTHS